MEGVPKKEINETSDRFWSPENADARIAEARELLSSLETFDHVTVDKKTWRALEETARELSNLLAGIPEHVRMAHGLPGGYIFAEQSANDSHYRFAA